MYGKSSDFAFLLNEMTGLAPGFYSVKAFRFVGDRTLAEVIFTWHGCALPGAAALDGRNNFSCGCLGQIESWVKVER